MVRALGSVKPELAIKSAQAFTEAAMRLFIRERAEDVAFGMRHLKQDAHRTLYQGDTSALSHEVSDMDYSMRNNKHNQNLYCSSSIFALMDTIF